MDTEERTYKLFKDLKLLIDANTSNFFNLTALLNELSQLDESNFKYRINDLVNIAVHKNFDALVSFFLIERLGGVSFTGADGERFAREAIENGSVTMLRLIVTLCPLLLLVDSSQAFGDAPIMVAAVWKFRLFRSSFGDESKTRCKTRWLSEECTRCSVLLWTAKGRP